MVRLFKDPSNKKINLLPLYHCDLATRFRATLSTTLENAWTCLQLLGIALIAIPLLIIGSPYFLFQTLTQRFYIWPMVENLRREAQCPGCQKPCATDILISTSNDLIHPIEEMEVRCRYCKTHWLKNLRQDKKGQWVTGDGQWQKLSHEESLKRILAMQ